jgi:hypothetical protein
MFFAVSLVFLHDRSGTSHFDLLSVHGPHHKWLTIEDVFELDFVHISNACSVELVHEEVSHLFRLNSVFLGSPDVTFLFLDEVLVYL